MKKELIKRIVDSGYKLTKARVYILDEFINAGRYHYTVEEIHQELLKKNIYIGISTVYRTISLFLLLDILIKIDLGDGYIRYEIFEEEYHHHHHLICRSCAKIIEVKENYIKNAILELQESYNFKIIGQKATFYGYCLECKNSMEKNEK